MAKASGGNLDHAGFLAIKDQLIAELAAAFEKKIVEMGEDAKGISWFSSCAETYVSQRQRQAA